MKLSRGLAKQAVITKCRGYIYAEPSRVFLQKAVDFRAKQKSVIICGQKLRGFPCLKKEMLNVWGMAKKVEEMFGGMKNILYLCIVFRITDSHRGLDHRFTQR